VLQLGAGVRSFAREDHSGPSGPCAQVELSGDLDDLPVVALGSFGGQRRTPRIRGGGEDLLADLLGELQADREPDHGLAAVIEGRVRGAAAVAAGNDLGLSGEMPRQDLQRFVEDRDVIVGGVRAGVAGAQKRRPRAGRRADTGRVEVGKHRVKPKPALVGWARAFLLGVRADQRRVDVDDQRPGRPARPAPGLPQPLDDPRPPGGQRSEQTLLGDGVDNPKGGRSEATAPNKAG